MATDPVDLSSLPTGEVFEQLGELLQLCLKSRGAGVFILRDNGEITVVDPRVLNAVPDEEIAFHLLSGGWDEDEIAQYLARRGS